MNPINRLVIFVLATCGLLAECQAGILDFSNYHTPAGVDTALTQLNTTYPGQTRILTIGTSIEGRPIKALKISSNPGVDDASKGDVVFVALHHAREWISVEMALYLADELLARYPSDPELHADMDRLQIWIVPVVNPDGYVYTTTTDRYWRKNRRNNGDGTFGVDPNRNWGYQWGLLSGASNITSSETYYGTGPFSEPEVATIRDFLAARQNLKCFLTYHSFSELFLRPWSYTTLDPPGVTTLRSLTDRAITRIAAVHGETYGPTIWYTSSGEATDYVWSQHRVAPFTTELRPSTGGLGGFSPPAAQILPSNEENLPSALALIHDAARTGIWIKDYAGDTGQEPSAVWTGGGWSHAFWESPDISTVPSVLNQGATVSLNVTVHNDTGAAQNNVTIDVYYTDPRISLEFPSPNSILIGTRTVNLPPGDTTITLPWVVPTGTNSWGELHWCVGVVIKHDNDLPLTTQVQKSSNIACRNFQTQPVLTSRIVFVAAQNYLRVPAEVILRADALPEGWTVLIPRLPEPPNPAGPVAIQMCSSARKARLLKTEGTILEPGQSILIPVRVDVGPNVAAGAQADLRIHGALLPLVAGKREAAGNGYTFRLIADRR